MPTLAAGAIHPHDITVFLLSVGVLLGLAKLLGEIARWCKQPSVLGEILAGVLLGPTLLGYFAPGAYDWLFPEAVTVEGERVYSATFIGLEMLITLSAVLLLLVAGLEVDLSTAWRQGKAALSVSLAGMIIPFTLGFVLAWYLPGMLGLEGEALERHKLPFALFVGIALSITALPVIARILMDLNLAKSDLGAVILASAIVNDLVGWIGFALVLALMQAGEASGAAQVLAAEAQAMGEVVGNAPGVAAETAHQLASSPASSVGATVVITLLFVFLTMTLGRWLVHRVLPFIQAHFAWPGGVLVFVFVLAMLCAALTEWIGIHSIFGAFILGVVVGDSSRLTNRTRETIHQFISNIFAPLFFASIGLRVSFVEAFDPVMVAVVLVVACVGKIFGCWAGAKLAGMSQRESWAVGFGMVGRGAMEIILGQLAYNHGLIGEELLVAIIVMALATSMISGPAMQMLLKRKQPRMLASMVSEKGFVGQLKARDREATIGELSHAAAAVTGVDATTIRDEVWRRERAWPTGMEGGVAVPHARLAELKKSHVIVGLSDEGIPFDAPDGSPSRIICLLLSPADKPITQIEMLEMVARAFAPPTARRSASQATSALGFRAALAVTSAEHEMEVVEEDPTPPPSPISRPT